jgi:hypothetical protein
VCRLHGGTLASSTQVSGWETAGDTPAASPAGQEKEAGAPGAPPSRRRVAQAAAKQTEPPPQPAPPKKSLFRRILDMFK